MVTIDYDTEQIDIAYYAVGAFLAQETASGKAFVDAMVNIPTWPGELVEAQWLIDNNNNASGFLYGPEDDPEQLLARVAACVTELRRSMHLIARSW